ncbi:MAG: ankyrin repeat domain-containing protein [Pirellulaceae bacterium]
MDKHLRLCRQDPVSLFPLDADSDERMPLAEAAIESPRHARPADSEYEGDNEDDDESEDDFEDEDDSEEESEQLVLPRITPLITETLVRDGERVCAIGIYDEVRRGLLPPRGGTAPNRLICGTAESIVKQLRGKMVGNFWGGLIAMLVLHGVVLAAMQLYLHSPDTRNRLSRDAFEAVRQNNRARLAELLRRGMPVDIRDSSGDTLLMASRDAETARWLVEQKIDINAVDDHGMTALMRAAHEGRAEIVRLLIDARANLNVRSTEYGRTALMHADDAGQVACAEMLREAGAEDDVVTARTGQPLPVNGGEPLAVCRDYLAAVHAREPDKLLRLTVRDTIGTFEDVDWQSWQASRPVAIDRFQGYVRGEDATVSVSGLTGAGFRTTWVYQLRRVSGVWKIAREDWDVSSVRGAR